MIQQAGKLSSKSAKLLLISVAGLVLIGGVTLLCVLDAPPSPEIVFVEFSEQDARFRVTNDSNIPYSYLGLVPYGQKIEPGATPAYVIRTFHGGSWHQRDSRFCRIGFEMIEIAPKSSVEFTVPADINPFQVGIYFTPGPPSAAFTPAKPPTDFDRVIFWIQERLNPGMFEPTWSTTAK